MTQDQYQSYDEYAQRLNAARQQRATPPQQSSGTPLSQLLAQQGYDYLTAPSATAGVNASMPVATDALTGGTQFAGGSVAPMTPTGITEAAPGAFDLSGIGSQGNVILPAVGAYGAYNLLQHQGDAPGRTGKAYARGIGQGAASGAAMGSYFGPAGAGIGAGIGALVGGLGAAFGSGKTEDQMKRDVVRKNLQQAGFLDQDFNLDTVHGNKINLGLDGSAKADWAGGNAPYNINTNNPFHHQSTGWAQILGAAIGNGDRKLATQFGGMLSNAAMSDADSMEGVRANILHFAQKLGLDRQKMEQSVNSLAQSGFLSPEEVTAYKGGIASLFGGAKQYVMDVPQQQQPQFVNTPKLWNSPAIIPPQQDMSIQTGKGGVSVAPNLPAEVQAGINSQVKPATNISIIDKIKELRGGK